jgi:hypothetical protein
MFRNTFTAWKPNTYGFGLGNIFATGAGTGAGPATAVNTKSMWNMFGTTGIRNTGNTGSQLALGTLGQWASYIISIVLVALIMLAFVHYFITPVFSLRPGGPGLITIPGFDDGAIYWKQDAVDLSNTVIGNNVMNYTIQFDMHIRNLPSSNIIQPVLSRGGSPSSTPLTPSSTIIQALPTHNIACALTNGTNDLLISVMDSTTTSTTLTLENVPVNKTVRIGIVVGSKAVEVYMNGKLANVKTYSGGGTPMNHIGPIRPPSSQSSTDIRNLHIWPRVLMPSELAAAGPALYEPQITAPMQTSTSTCS